MLKKDQIKFSAFSRQVDYFSKLQIPKKGKKNFQTECQPLFIQKEVKINIKNVLLTPMPYLCLALPLSKHTGTHGVQNMLNKKTFSYVNKKI
jgi:hypothetical protein